MRRGITATALAATLALAATACGSDGESAAARARAASSPARSPGGTPRPSAARTRSSRSSSRTSEAKHPGIKVKYVNVPFGEAQNKFKNAAQSGSGAPDVIRSEVAWTPEFADPRLPRAAGRHPRAEEREGLPAGRPLARTKYNDKTYAVPQVIDSLGHLLQQEAAQGGRASKCPSHVERVEDRARDVKDKTGKTGLYLAYDAYWFLSFLYGEGGDLLDAQSKTITVDTPASVKAMAVVDDLITSGAAKTAIHDSYANAMTALKDGKAAMIYNGPWALSEIYQGRSSRTRRTWASRPSRRDRSRPGAPQGGRNLAIYAGSKNLDASYEFVRFMSTPESQARVAKEMSLLPTRTSVYYNPDVRPTRTSPSSSPSSTGRRAALDPRGRPALPAALETEYTVARRRQATPEEGSRRSTASTASSRTGV